MARSTSFSAPLTEFTRDGDPVDGPAYVDLVEGRWRTAYTGGPVMVCLASRGRADWSSDVETVRGRCGLVEAEPPVELTITVHFGGIGVSTD